MKNKAISFTSSHESLFLFFEKSGTVFKKENKKKLFIKETPKLKPSLVVKNNNLNYFRKNHQKKQKKERTFIVVFVAFPLP